MFKIYGLEKDVGVLLSCYPYPHALILMHSFIPDNIM